MTNFYKLANNCQTTLKTDMDSSQTTMEVDDNSTFPASFPFILTIWDSYIYGSNNASLDPTMEIVEVTSLVSGTTYNITREMEGTSGSEHFIGQTVAMLITAAIITQLQTAINALE